MEQVKIVKTPNVAETLRQMSVGIKSIASKTVLPINAVRSCASRLKDENLEFTVEDIPTKMKYYITRTK
jgi:hypothetical protein